MIKKQIGKLGEILVKKYLLNRGFIFVSQNFYSRYGEIDLIFEKQGQLVFVEVKTRTSNLFGEAVEAVTSQKLRNMHKTAEYYMSYFSKWGSDWRFDILSVQMDLDNGSYDLKHFENVFS